MRCVCFIKLFDDLSVAEKNHVVILIDACCPKKVSFWRPVQSSLFDQVAVLLHVAAEPAQNPANRRKSDALNLLHVDMGVCRFYIVERNG